MHLSGIKVIRFDVLTSQEKNKNEICICIIDLLEHN